VLSWLESNWLGVVQTIAAVAQVVTAAFIVRLTRRLAESTDAYAKSAKDQVDELVQARLATITPYLHLVTAGQRSTADPYLIGFEVDAELTNLGSGPALDAVASLWHERLQFSTETPPQTVATGGSCKLSFTVSGTTADPGGHTLPQDARLLVEYRDLAGRWWRTTTPATLGYDRQANGTYREPKLTWAVQEETVRRIEQPSLSGSVLAEDRTLHIGDALWS